MPHCLLVRNLIHGMYAEKLAETGAVYDLILNLLVAQAIIAL